ncbi:GTPase family protein [Frigidibacter mobilis]|uniref:Kinase n=1 Tax=Frigidibacter mobilis TaxID=1335048 RepID=A0A159Z0N5_9RHOB|nr:GTPase [Frigidibacter mobilis]AMY67444.1 kinase [Frigidibacter mobilis]
MRHRFERLWQKLSAPAGSGEGAADLPPELAARPLPVIWLLGKTGAGKSTLVRALTGLPQVEVGNGFAPCTRASAQFDFPQGLPLMRFLDTRGLGEAGYDPAEDLALCQKAAHVILVVARLDDPVQGEVADVLATLRRRQGKLRALVVHTGADLLGTRRNASAPAPARKGCSTRLRARRCRRWSCPCPRWTRSRPRRWRR